MGRANVVAFSCVARAPLFRNGLLEEPGCALPNFDDIAIRIADVASRLAELLFRFGQKRRSAAFPKLVAPLNVCDAKIQEATDFIGVGGRERDRRFVGCRRASTREDEPRVRDLDERRIAATEQASTYNFRSEHGRVEFG